MEILQKHIIRSREVITVKNEKYYEKPIFVILDVEDRADVVTASSGFGPGQELPDIDLYNYS